ncbi:MULTISPECIES: hypothetical protein [unclassified Glutamicibacter]|uniref:hypothetical protein n=1 Tax=unclassified Glutamicibacter TaxID=2627139 RepID=UPI0037FFDFB5
MSLNLGTPRKRAELPNALHGCTSNPCGSVVCQTVRDRDELLSRLEQAEAIVNQLTPTHLKMIRCALDGDPA